MKNLQLLSVLFLLACNKSAPKTEDFFSEEEFNEEISFLLKEEGIEDPEQRKTKDGRRKKIKKNLPAEVQATYERIQNYSLSLKNQYQTLCPRDDKKTPFKEEIKTIKKNKEIRKKEKLEQIKAILAKQEETRKELKKDHLNCLSQKKVQMGSLMIDKKILQGHCLLKKQKRAFHKKKYGKEQGAKHKDARKKNHLKKRKAMKRKILTAFIAKLKSQECQDYLTQKGY